MALALPASVRAQAVVDLDPATDTVRMAARLDGALTRPASGTAAAIGLRYVREHRAALGLSAADLETLGDAEVETFAGIRQVRWRQAVDGIEVADAELRVSVAEDGRVLNVLGSPSSDLPTDTTPRLGKPDPDAELTIYDDRLAYRYEDAVATDAIYDVISDADTGRILKRTNLVKSVDADVWDLHPSVGTAKTVSLDPWLLPGATTLQGRWVRAYSDLDDNDAAGAGEEITPGQWPLVTFPGIGCSDEKPCTWSAANRQANRQQNGNQAFYLANRFREHLAKAPINFDEFEGVDRLILETNDGGGTNNANMYTPPDGKSPRMQMYLWSTGGYRAFNSGDDASILFHEYTHGLTGRLVKTPDGVGALSSWQAGAMGEGWSDFYAKDFTVSEGLEPDDPDTPGQVDMGVYSDATPKTLRSGALDCPVNVANAKCPTGGGYTYGDFGKIANGPEVHYDGEIWAQTLWDLRTAIGPADARRLVTAALRLSPPEPSFIDMRNAILVAAAADPATLRAKLWSVFAKRGMGFYASATDGSDVAPVENFQTPPDTSTPRGKITGTVTDASGAPVRGITVSVGGLEAGPDKRVAVTGANGTYEIPDVPVGTYANLVAAAPGYDRALIKNITVTAATPGVANATVRRNWAIGATLRSSAGSENADMGCGPKQAFDGLPGSTWSTAGSGGKELVLELPEAIDVTGFGIDPGAGCGDDERSAMKDFQIAVGPSATGPWTAVVPTGTVTPGHKVNVFPVTRGNVTYVRLLPTSTQGAASYIDVSEFAVYGAPRVTSTRFKSTPATVTRNPVATYEFDGGTSYECQWDSDPAAPCTSPVSRELTEGKHRFAVTATGPAGPDPTPAVHEVTLDTTAPQLPPLTSSVSGTSATFGFSATDATAVTFTCTLDGDVSACTSPKAYTGLTPSTHDFTVTATDAAGNTASRAVTVDTSFPETLIVAKPPEVTREARPTFIFSGGDTYACNLDAKGYQPCPALFPALSDDPHTLLVLATKGGRTDPTPASYTWVVDTTAPTLAISSASASAATATFAFAASDRTKLTFACTLDGNTAPCSSPARYTGLADGAHAFRVTATDAAGNTASAFGTVTVDATPPETIISWAPPPILTTRDFAFAFGASEPASFACSLDGAPAYPCVSPLALTSLPDGAHSLVVTAIDASGQADPTPARSDFVVAIPGRSVPPTPTPTAMPKRTALSSASSVKTVSRRTGRVTVKVRGSSGAKVVVQAKVGSRVVGKATKTLRATTLSVPLTLERKRLRVGATVTVTVKATGAGMSAVTRSLRIRVKA